MDAFCLNALIDEVQRIVRGTTISRVVQPDRWSLMLIFQRHGPEGLVLSVKPGAPRVELRSPTRKPSSPPSRFGDLIASKTQGALIEAVEQVGLDRIMAIHMRSGSSPEAAMTLYVEMLGPASNVVLVDRVTGTMIDRLRSPSGKAGGELPGRGGPYRSPCDPGRIDPRKVKEDEFQALVRTRLVEGIEPARALMTCFTAFSSMMATDLVTRSGLSTRAPFDEQARLLWKPFCNLIARLLSGRFEPRLLLGNDGQPVGLSAFPLITVPADRQVRFASMSEAAHAFHAGREKAVGQESLRAQLLRRLSREVAATERLSARLAKDAAIYSDAGLHARKGQLLLANRTAIQRGAQIVELPDYTDPAQRALRVELDPARSIEGNAEHYFALHRKAKRGAGIVSRRLEETAVRLARLRTLIQEVEIAKGLVQLQQVEAAFARMTSGQPAPTKAASRAERSEGPGPRAFRSSDGLPILVGRSGPGNDHLTWRLARPHDLWLHAQGIPGSHVLVRLQKGKQMPPRTLREAAQLAAYYSRARAQAKVAVDYVLRKYLRKPKGAPPGTVLLTQEKTITVRPEADLVRRLHAAAGAGRGEG